MINTLTKNAQEISLVTLGSDPITIEEFVAVARYRARIEFSAEYDGRVRRSRTLIEKFLQENRLIYGVTTGFGDNVTEVIAPEDAEALQRNIVLSHAVSVGQPLPEEIVRGVQLMMLVGLGQGFSGISIGTLALIRDLLNHNITPYVPGDGSVGYLAVEAHMAMVLIGEGRVWVAGEVVSSADGLRAANLEPVALGCKEGLCLTNGTHSVTAIAVLTAYDAVRAATVSDLIAAMSLEALKGTIKAFDPRLHAMKKHPEQQAVAANVRKVLAGSAETEARADYRVQDTYSLRGIPQIHGAAKRAIKDAVAVIRDELHSVGDNPVIIPEGQDGTALMGANFDSTFAGLQSDLLSMAMTVIAKVSERRTDRMLNSAFSELPAFLAPNPGLNNGYMIAQYTAAALYMEMKALSLPASIDSVPTSANQEDPVSNAYLAAMQAYTAAGKLRYVLAIELMCAVQASELGDGLASSPVVQAIQAAIRKEVPTAVSDRFFGDDIERIERLLFDGQILRIVEENVGELAF
ncbi:histidine ammonia-lyase [Arthrobacter sp. NPDC058127]|uniref:HAL/PAL/TAL family ammonia-lyase n=1 Tax=Arthrobacter sp. NPDC058127 TaxID=3346351 RepID=UPI0036E59FED